ncbi:MAG: YihY/virulence factor BrkB family protein [Natronohydrobacter sp.]|nr:YihY/virulence factor BrkB family protein [Natronohydrobacter sp.]
MIALPPRLLRIWTFARDFNHAMSARNIGLLSAGVAFFSLLALFPGIAALISVFGFFADPLVLQDQLSLLQDLIPPAAYTLLSNQITRLVWANEGVLGWTSIISIFVALFLARRGVDAMLLGIYAIHGTPRRKGFSHAIRVLFITLGMLVAGVVALLSVLIVPVVLALFPLIGSNGYLIETLRWALTLGLVAGWIWVFYRIGPNRNGTARPVLIPGLVLAVVLWVTVSVGLSFYLSNFGNYNEVYGSIGAVVALLMWFYISAYAVLLGGVLNATLEAGTPDAPPLSPMSDETDPPGTG